MFTLIFNNLPSDHLAGLRRLEIDSDDLTELGRPPRLPSSAPAPVLLVELPPPVVAPRFRDLKHKQLSTLAIQVEINPILNGRRTE